MSQPTLIPLPDRGLLAVTGPDRLEFLQGLLSNDVARAADGRAVWAALLTPQGKYLHDVFVLPFDGALALDCEAGRRDDLKHRLEGYRLRSDVDILDVTEFYDSLSLLGDGAAQAVRLADEPGAVADYGGGLAWRDPRHPGLGVRLTLPREAGHPAGFAHGDPADWDRARLALGIPDGSRDLVPERSILLENGFDELRGVSWDKGCYVGQELTARTKYRGLVRKRLLPVRIDGEPPPPGTPVLAGESEAGELRSGRDGLALALLRLDALETGAPLTAGTARVTPMRPDWMRA